MIFSITQGVIRFYLLDAYRTKNIVVVCNIFSKYKYWLYFCIFFPAWKKCFYIFYRTINQQTATHCQ